MKDNDGNSAIRIHLDISVPTGGNVRVGRSEQPARDYGLVHEDIRTITVTHPEPDGTTLAKQVGDRWYMCAYGTTGETVPHVFAMVHDGNLGGDPDATPPLDNPYVLWTRPQSPDWKWMFKMLPIPGAIGAYNPKTLVVWAEHPDGKAYYPPKKRLFTATSAYQTYCETYGLTVANLSPAASDWSRTAARWLFTAKGFTNAARSNCAILNGEWLLTSDPSCSQGLRWHRKLDSSFVDPKQPCWWRLSFSRDDGFWYLECVTSPNQAVGTSISYRRHETVWDPCGPNELYLLTHHGHCNAPATLTLIPA